MARKPTGNPVGPPKKHIAWEQFENFCSLQCTQSEMADMMHIDADTLRSRVKEHYGDDYSVIYKRLSSPGKCSLRRYQFLQAKKNCTMAIWLGKNWLDQKDSDKNDRTPPNDQYLSDLHELLKQNKELKDKLESLQQAADGIKPKAN